MRRPLALLTAATLALAASCTDAGTDAGTGAGPAASPTTTTAATTAPTTTAPDASAVATRQESFVDGSRPTAANGDYPGAPDRAITVFFWYPAAGAAPDGDGAPAGDRPFPLILFSHGHDGHPLRYRALLADLAAAGYVVAAPAYPLTNSNAPGGPNVVDLPNQPADASYVLDSILARARERTSWLYGMVDAARIGAAGHSLGALTTYALVYNDCCHDRRITAAVAIAGTAAGFPDDGYFTGAPVPLLAIHGDHDDTLGIDLGRTSFDRARRPKFFLTILGGEHSTEARGGTTAGQQALTGAVLAFFDHYLRGDPNGLRELRAVGQRAGLTTLVAEP